MDKRVSDEALASIAGMARGNLKTSRAEINIVERLALDETASRAEIARLAAQLAKKERILEEIRLQGDSPEWQHEICMSCLKLIPHNHANCYDCKAAMIQMDMESPVPPADVTDAMEQAMLDEIDWELIGNIQGAVRKDGGVLDVTLRAMLMRGLRAALAARTKSADTP